MGGTARYEAHLKPISGSTVQAADKNRRRPEGSAHESSADKPLFETLRVKTTCLSDAHWRFSIRFLLLNDTSPEIHLEDIHAKVYRKYIPSPPLLTIGYRGEVVLQEDNTIAKEEKSYSLAPGDGYEIDLILELTRIEGSPVYGTDRERPGPILAVLGLLVDYYYLLPDGSVKRRTVPSDSLYFFECLDRKSGQRSTLRFVDNDLLKELEADRYTTDTAKAIASSIRHLVEEHRAYDPTPKA